MVIDEEKLESWLKSYQDKNPILFKKLEAARLPIHKNP
jgi:hypothetical protein